MDVLQRKLMIDLIIRQVIELEGGYVNHPADKGGATKYGISQKTYPGLDIKNLSQRDAIKIYYNDWWCKYQVFDEVLKISFLVAKLLFGFAVNVGMSQASRSLQRAINKSNILKEEPPLIVDGIIGSKSLHAIRSLARYSYSDIAPLRLHDALKQECIDFYQNLATQKKHLAIFLKGWLNRVDTLSQI